MTRDDSGESFVLTVLRQSFPEELSGLTQLSHYQRPDLQDESAGIGVEVTVAQYGNNKLMQGHSLASMRMGNVLSVEDDQKMQFLGVVPVVENGTMTSYVEAFWVGDSYPAVREAILAKMKKLNKGHYDSVSDVRLAVKDELDVSDACKLKECIEEAINCSKEKGYKRFFTHVYVLPQAGGVVYDYKLEDDSLSVHPFICSGS